MELVRTTMDTLTKYAVEVIGPVWLVIVALQYVSYLSRYFVPARGELDFTFAYIVMLCLVVGIGLYRAIRFCAGRRG